MKKVSLIKLIAVLVLVFSLGFFVANIIQTARNNSSQNTRNGSVEEETSNIISDSTIQNQSDETDIEYSSFQNQIPTNAEFSADGYTEDEKINIGVYGSRNESVVNITTEVLAYNWFFEPVPQEGGIGSGSIIDADGYILTNNHVIDKATKVYVTLWDSTKLEGKVIGVDRENDLAIVKIDSKGLGLRAIPLGNSASLKVGQKVLAIGNPFGLDRTLTTGVISGLGRPVRSSRNIVIRNMIQTDAAINPGNSGGPLLNSKGEIIGVNTIIFSTTQGSIGLGFAVPSDTVARVLPELIKFGKVRRGWIEWNMRPLFPELVRYAKLPVEQGLLITEVQKKGNADDAGIRGGDRNNAVRYGRTTILLGGDIVTEVNGKDVASLSDYLEALEQTHPNDIIVVKYFRNKKEKSTKVKLIERPDDIVIEQ